jgi:peptidoglycan/xylan/chitin deacetylase (PgdA/CDA1 family)
MTPARKAALCLSWDDGHPADRRVAERMLQHGLRGTFFVPVSNSEGHPVMGAQDLRALYADGFEIGAHGLDHHRLTPLSHSEMQRQIVEGKRRLEDILGGPVTGFCYPGGRHNRQIRSAVAESGFTYGRTTEMFRLDRGVDPYRLPTTMQLHRHDGGALLRNWLRQGMGVERLRLALQQWRVTNLSSQVTALQQRAATEAGVLHLWGHSWEIDRLERWGWLDAILAGLDASVSLPRLTCSELVQ